MFKHQFLFFSTKLFLNFNCLFYFKVVYNCAAVLQLNVGCLILLMIIITFFNIEVHLSTTPWDEEKSILAASVAIDTLSHFVRNRIHLERFSLRSIRLRWLLCIRGELGRLLLAALTTCPYQQLFQQLEPAESRSGRGGRSRGNYHNEQLRWRQRRWWRQHHWALIKT